MPDGNGYIGQYSVCSGEIGETNSWVITTPTATPYTAKMAYDNYNNLLYATDGTNIYCFDPVSMKLNTTVDDYTNGVLVPANSPGNFFDLKVIGQGAYAGVYVIGQSTVEQYPLCAEFAWPEEGTGTVSSYWQTLHSVGITQQRFLQ